MKRNNMEIITDRTKSEDINFEKLLAEFEKSSREKRKKNKSKLKNHRR